MTLDEEFEKKFGGISRAAFEAANKAEDITEAKKKEMLDWFKSYILSLMESVKLEKPRVGSIDLYELKRGYNQALRDQEAKIAEELKGRGI